MLQITIDETTARMAVAAMRERAESMRRAARSRANSGMANVEYRAKLRVWAADYDQRAAAIRTQYERKAKRCTCSPFQVATRGCDCGVIDNA